MRRGAYADRIRSRSSHFLMARSLASALRTIGIALFSCLFLFFLDPYAAIDAPFFEFANANRFPTHFALGARSSNKLSGTGKANIPHRELCQLTSHLNSIKKKPGRRSSRAPASSSRPQGVAARRVTRGRCYAGRIGVECDRGLGAFRSH